MAEFSPGRSKPAVVTRAAGDLLPGCQAENGQRPGAACLRPACPQWPSRPCVNRDPHRNRARASEGRPATESTIARTTGLSKQTVARPAAGAGVRFCAARSTTTVAAIPPSSICSTQTPQMIRPGRVRRVREAIKRHGEEMRAAIQAMDQAQTAQD